MICPSELATLANAISVSIAQGKTVEELNIIAALLVQISDTLNTIAVQKSIIQSRCEKKKNYDNSTLHT